MRNTRPKPRIIPIKPQPPLLPVPDWTDGIQYKMALAELGRMARIEGAREAQLIKEAEHEAELRYLRRKAKLTKPVLPPGSDPTAV
jgi:hypothetical protein